MLVFFGGSRICAVWGVTGAEWPGKPPLARRSRQAQGVGWPPGGILRDESYRRGRATMERVRNRVNELLCIWPMLRDAGGNRSAAKSPAFTGIEMTTRPGRVLSEISMTLPGTRRSNGVGQQGIDRLGHLGGIEIDLRHCAGLLDGDLDVTGMCQRAVSLRTLLDQFR